MMPKLVEPGDRPRRSPNLAVSPGMPTLKLDAPVTASVTRSETPKEIEPLGMEREDVALAPERASSSSMMSSLREALWALAKVCGARNVLDSERLATNGDQDAPSKTRSRPESLAKASQPPRGAISTHAPSR